MIEISSNSLYNNITNVDQIESLSLEFSEFRLLFVQHDLPQVAWAMNDSKCAIKSLEKSEFRLIHHMILLTLQMVSKLCPLFVSLSKFEAESVFDYLARFQRIGVQLDSLKFDFKPNISSLDQIQNSQTNNSGQNTSITGRSSFFKSEKFELDSNGVIISKNKLFVQEQTPNIFDQLMSNGGEVRRSSLSG